MKPETKYLDKTEGLYETEYARISTILETTPDIPDGSQDTVRSDQIDRITELRNMFEYLKDLLIKLSRKGENTPIYPDDINVEYIEAASRYCYPVLFDKYAVLDQDDSVLHKIEMANDILHKFGLTEMYEYENLINSGEIDLEFIDRRDPNEEPILTHMGGDTKLNKW